VIQVNDERYWLYAAAAPATNRFFHVRLFPTRATALTVLFLRELRDEQQTNDATVLIDSAPHLTAPLDQLGLRFQSIATEIETASNVSPER
jgi:transposase-like protein